MLEMNLKFKHHCAGEPVQGEYLKDYLICEGGQFVAAWRDVGPDEFLCNVDSVLRYGEDDDFWYAELGKMEVTKG